MNEVKFMNYTYISKLDESSIYTYNLKIIDLCDYFVICVLRTPAQYSMSTLSKVIELYKEMDIHPEVHDTPYHVNNDTLRFIENVCGRYISSITNKKDDIIKDLSKIIQFKYLQNDWGRKKLQLESNIETATDNIPTHKIENDATLPAQTLGFETSTYHFSEITDEVAILSDVHNVFIIYNKLFNLVLVIKDSKNFLEEMCKDFPDFEIVGEFPCIIREQDVFEKAKPFFHQTLFEFKSDVENKINAFRTLFNFTVSPCGTDERTEVQNIMHRLFDINTDPKERMRALELYMKVSSYIPRNHIQCSNDSILHKRLAAYFLEMGLIKKRFSDGVYYYGIKLKTVDTSKLSVKEMMKQRNYDCCL